MAHQKTVVQRLQGIRNSAGESIGNLSRKLGMSRDELIAIESGSVQVGEWFVEVYLDALDIGGGRAR